MNIFKIIRLDLRILEFKKRNLYFLLFLLIAIMAVSFPPAMEQYVLGIAVIMNLNIFDTKEKYDLESLYVSLPFQKKQVILARYISVIINSIPSAVVIPIFYLIEGKYQIYFTAVSVIFLLFSLITALQLPIYMGIGYKDGKVYTLIIYAVFVVICSIGPWLKGLAPCVEKILYFIIAFDSDIEYIVASNRIVVRFIVSFFLLGISAFVSLMVNKKYEMRSCSI